MPNQLYPPVVTNVLHITLVLENQYTCSPFLSLPKTVLNLVKKSSFLNLFNRSYASFFEHFPVLPHSTTKSLFSCPQDVTLTWKFPTTVLSQSSLAFPHSDAWFELKQVNLPTPMCLNALSCSDWLIRYLS